jgi:hypothetical protein
MSNISGLPAPAVMNADPLEPSTTDFSRFIPRRLHGDFEPIYLTGQLDGQRVYIRFNHASPDRVFATSPDGLDLSLDLQQIDQLQGVLAQWTPKFEPSEQGKLDHIRERVSRASQLRTIRDAVLGASREDSEFGAFVGGTEIKAQLDAALVDGTIDAFEHGVILSGYQRAQDSNLMTQDGINAFTEVVESGQFSWSTEVWNIALGGRVLDGTTPDVPQGQILFPEE